MRISLIHLSLIILTMLILPLGGSASGKLDSLENRLQSLQIQMRETDSDEIRFSLNDEFRTLLISTLENEGSFDYPFSKLDKMGVLWSPDKQFRMFNWNVPRNNETHKYFCLIQRVLNEKKGQYALYELTDDEKRKDKLEYKYLKEDEWSGALYYKIIASDKNAKTYTLLGWDGNNKLSNIKVIDALSFSGQKVRMGAPIFKTEKGLQKRVIFEYSKEANMSLKYYEKSEEIVFDHLSPKDPSLAGQKSFYGPDLSFDRFYLEKGKWIFEGDIDVRMDKERNKRPYNQPR